MRPLQREYDRRSYRSGFQERAPAIRRRRTPAPGVEPYRATVHCIEQGIVYVMVRDHGDPEIIRQEAQQIDALILEPVCRFVGPPRERVPGFELTLRVNCGWRGKFRNDVIWDGAAKIWTPSLAATGRKSFPMALEEAGFY